MLDILPLPLFLLLPPVAMATWFRADLKNSFTMAGLVILALCLLTALIFGNYGTICYQLADTVWASLQGSAAHTEWERVRAMGIFVTWVAILPLTLYIKNHHIELEKKGVSEIMLRTFIVFYGWMMVAAFFARATGL